LEEEDAYGHVLGILSGDPVRQCAVFCGCVEDFTGAGKPGADATEGSYAEHEGHDGFEVGEVMVDKEDVNDVEGRAEEADGLARDNETYCECAKDEEDEDDGC